MVTVEAAPGPERRGQSSAEDRAPRGVPRFEALLERRLREDDRALEVVGPVAGLVGAEVEYTLGGAGGGGRRGEREDEADAGGEAAAYFSSRTSVSRTGSDA